MADAWQPEQYQRFRDERAPPFHDLAALVEREPGMRVLDLGCGTGELTAWLHGTLGAQHTRGIDRSEAMLAKARAHATTGLDFVLGDIATLVVDDPVDLVFSNAALHWLNDHPALFARLRDLLRPGGQIAVQMPANQDHPSHRMAAALAAEAPYARVLGGSVRPPTVLTPPAYAELLDALGFARQHVRLQVYAHRLPTTESVVEWVKGTLLTPYRERLPDDVYAPFLATYRERLLATLGARAPYLYAFPRILLWARLPGPATA